MVGVVVCLVFPAVLLLDPRFSFCLGQLMARMVPEQRVPVKADDPGCLAEYRSNELGNGRAPGVPFTVQYLLHCRAWPSALLS